MSPRLGWGCVPALLQVSLFGLLSRGRFELEELGISEASDGAQHFAKRDFPLFDHFPFHSWVLI